MIRQPFSSAELHAMTTATPLTERASVRGMQGWRIWNVTPWWWQLQAEGDAGRLLALVAPWRQATGNFEDQELDDLILAPAVDLPQLTLVAIGAGQGWRFMYEFTPDKLDQRTDQLVGTAVT